MTIYDLMKQDGVRITRGNKWLILEGDGEWVIYERKYYAKNSKIIARGYDEDAAVKIMSD